MALPYTLPATLVNALNSFDFKGRTIWTLASGMKHVKVELTFLLDQPTDRQARAVKKRKPAPMPTTRLRETAPPTTAVMTATRPTVTYQRPANSATLMPPPTLRPPQQRVLELGATAKRRSRQQQLPPRRIQLHHRWRLTCDHH